MEGFDEADLGWLLCGPDFWLGCHEKHGWIVLDYDHPTYRAKEDVLVFEKITDGAPLHIRVTEWKAPTVEWVSNYLKQRSNSGSTQVRELIRLMRDWHWERIAKRRRRQQMLVDALESPACAGIFAELERTLDVSTRGNPPALVRPADWNLVNQWAQARQGDNWWRGAMISARRAELFMLDVYRQLGRDVRDLSIRQVADLSDPSWMIGDIDLDGVVIDVKNARPVFRCTGYSEHCVPQFKASRDLADVVVSATLSPFVDDRRGDAVYSVRWLGEIRATTINELNQRYSSDSLEVAIPIDRPDRGGKFFLPPWLFDYPDAVYRCRDEVARQLESDQTLFGQPYDTGQVAPSHRWDSLLSKLDPDLPTRPQLFLIVLTHFVEAALAGTPFRKEELLRSIFVGYRTGDDEYSADPGAAWMTSLPLLCFDPMETIFSLIGTLSRAYGIVASRPKRFLSFKLTGPGVLRGQTDARHWQTILAYCGGRTKANAPCGYTPLEIGCHRLCDRCGYLRCPRCGWCSHRCGRRVDSERDELEPMF